MSKHVSCGPGGTVGEYVPFYFAPRSPMLFRIQRGGVEGVSSDPARLVYVVSSAEAVVEAGHACVFTDGNAAAAFTEGAPAPEQMPERRARPRMTAFRATLVWLLSRYLAPGEAASPLEVQKLLYFLQEAGEPLGLRFAKQRFGPYADAARHAVLHIEGHYVTGFGDGTGPGDVHPLPGAVEEAEAFLADHPETRERYDRVVELIDGFETPYGFELLATTHWVATHEDADTAVSAAQRVRAWSHRKQHLFTDEHVAVAWERLDGGGWLAGTREPGGRVALPAAERGSATRSPGC